MNKEKIIRRTFSVSTDIRIREASEAGDSRTITGYAILFNTPSVDFWNDDEGEGREIIAPGAVTRELLDGSDIKMTMFHNREKILARSKEGKGTLTYGIDEKGVWFEFEAPATALGDEALELVRRGDLAGCSFAFSTRYYDESCVEHKVEKQGSRTVETYIVKSMTGIYDFTICADPAYPDTSVEAREFVTSLREPEAPEKEPEVSAEKIQAIREQVASMRAAARAKVNIV